MTFLDFFTDPILRGPTIGSMLMSLAAALVGVCLFIRKRSLLGEALSHATYPGVTFAIIFSGIFAFEKWLPFTILFGAFLSALIGFVMINFLQRRLKVSEDAALCGILALFFGVGMTIASYAQSSYTHLFRQIQVYLYGQTATMTDIHILLYSVLAILVIGAIVLFYRDILMLSFDSQFAQSCSNRCQFIEILLFIFIILAIVIGIRCSGVILMSAMLVAPATAARQFTNRLSHMFFLSSVFGVVSGFFGTYLSVVFSDRYSFPTGPMIVLVSGAIAIYALLFAPERGLLIRFFRIARFRALTVQENLLKALWRLSHEGEKELSFSMITAQQGFSKLYLRFLLLRLMIQGWIKKKGKVYRLTAHGTQRGGQIVRLHRLWEAYLVHSLGLRVERVHKSAEEMEHILTPELEKKLTVLLDNPKHDPHDQPIPPTSYETIPQFE